MGARVPVATGIAVRVAVLTGAGVQVALGVAVGVAAGSSGEARLNRHEREVWLPNVSATWTSAICCPGSKSMP